MLELAGILGNVSEACRRRARASGGPEAAAPAGSRPAFVARRVRPHTRVERSRQALAVSLAFCAAPLALLVAVILSHRQLGT